MALAEEISRQPNIDSVLWLLVKISTMKGASLAKKNTKCSLWRKGAQRSVTELSPVFFKEKV